MKQLNSHIERKLAYEKGAIAASNKKKVGDNPFYENSNEHWEWMQGFVDITMQLKGNSTRGVLS